MATPKMHADELPTGLSLVRQLIATQFPAWAALPLAPVTSSGTDNVLYRLGDDKVVRLPRLGGAVAQREKEHRWLPWLAPRLPLALPVPLAQGAPGAGYPFPWSVYRWLDGETVAPGSLSDPAAARALGYFLRTLQCLDPAGGPDAATHGLRGVPLVQRDTPTRTALAALADRLEYTRALRIWKEALAAPEWHRSPVWFHGDFLRGNLLFAQGRAHAVIDFGGLGVGDPACDLMVAWNLFSPSSRAHFREALAPDDATWRRGRGHALSQAALFIPYYEHTNPLGVAFAWHTLEQVLADTDGD